MSEKATGNDWKLKKIPTLRHAAGALKFRTIKPKKKRAATIAFAVIMFHLSWLEYMRLALQFSIIINFLYFMIMLLKNVTIGCIPVVAYLLLCFYISGSADFASFSIIAPNLPAEFSNWNTLLVVFSSSLLGLLLGYLLDRFWYKYL